MTFHGGKGLRRVTGLALAATLTLGAVTPAMAGGTSGDAEKLRRLDIMLMVTSLRCRTTADNFSAEYSQFSSNHLGELNQASNRLRADLSRQHGQVGSARALDRISTVMANAYGQGHPWLSCRELKMVTRDLAQMRGHAPLVEAADQLLGERGGAELAYARR
jgi:hypothetical protein